MVLSAVLSVLLAAWGGGYLLKKIRKPEQHPTHAEQATPDIQTAGVPQAALQAEPQKTAVQKENPVNLQAFGRPDPYLPLIKKVEKKTGIKPVMNLPKLPTLSPPSIPLPPALPTEPPLPYSPLKVVGIIWDKNPIAILEGEGVDAIVSAGDFVSGYKVVQISKTKVFLKRGKEKKALFLGGGESSW